jgi:sulfide dehydrogenase cytochrome subunit
MDERCAMTLRISPLFAAAVTVFATVGLGACQTTTPAPATAPAPPPPAAQPAEAPPVVPPKPIAPEAARNLANNCFTCHGPNGHSPGTIPSIANLSAEEIATRLKNFRSGSAPSTVMGRHAKAYGDAEIEAVAKYIAALKK